jgi:hypothetical protein
MKYSSPFEVVKRTPLRNAAVLGSWFLVLPRLLYMSVQEVFSYFSRNTLMYMKHPIRYSPGRRASPILAEGFSPTAHALIL